MYVESSDEEGMAEGERDREGGRANSWWTMRNRPRGRAMFVMNLISWTPQLLKQTIPI